MIKQTLAAAGLTAIMTTAAGAQEQTANDCVLSTYENIAGQIGDSLTNGLGDQGQFVTSMEAIYSHEFVRGVAAACEAITGDDADLWNKGEVTITRGNADFVFEGP